MGATARGFSHRPPAFCYLESGILNFELPGVAAFFAKGHGFIRAANGRKGARLQPPGRPPLASAGKSIHTPNMSLKNAALLALIGTVLLTVLLAAHFISTLLGVLRDLIPAMALVGSLVYLFASFSVLVFFYVFYRKQS